MDISWTAPFIRVRTQSVSDTRSARPDGNGGNFRGLGEDVMRDIEPARSQYGFRGQRWQHVNRLMYIAMDKILRRLILDFIRLANAWLCKNVVFFNGKKNTKKI